MSVASSALSPYLRLRKAPRACLCGWRLDWEESWGKREKISPDSKLYRGGALADHPHVFDVARLLTGSTFKSVYCEVAPNIRELETEDLIRVMGNMENGVMFSIDPSYANNENKVIKQVNWERYPRCVVRRSTPSSKSSGTFARSTVS